MNDPRHTWNPDDGPPPTEAELRDAERLGAALEPGGKKELSDDARDHGSGAPSAATASRSSDGSPEPPPAIRDLLDVALRVKATARPDRDAAREASARAVRVALERHAPRRGWARGPYLRIAAAAGLVLAAAGVGGREYLRARPGAPVTISRPAGDVLTEEVRPGAGSAPSSRLYESRLRSYRDAMLGGSP